MKFLNEAKEIDVKKRALESTAIIKLKKIFNNIADDVSNIILTTTNYNEIAENYKPDFITAFRDIYRSTIRTFGFTLREKVENKHCLDFKLDKQKELLKTLETKQDLDNIETSKEEQDEINRLFMLATILYINNTSEIQAGIITETNKKEIQKAIDMATAEYNAILADNMAEQDKTTKLIEDYSVGVFFGMLSEKEKENLEKELEDLKLQKEKLISNRTKIISRNFSDNFKRRGKTRSEVIAEFEVGQTESFIRAKEASIISGVKQIGLVTLNVKKNWESMGDSKVREGHQIADANYHFNPISLDESFLVNGEMLRYARDPSGSASNIINCRCCNIYTTD